MSSSSQHRLWLAATLLCCACSVGAPIVDEWTKPPDDGVGPLPCATPPDCEALPEVSAPVHAAAPVELSSCGAEAACWFDIADSPGIELQRTGVCPDAATQFLPNQASCTSLELHAAAGVSELTLHAAAWSNVNLTIESDSPLQVTLADPQLAHVFIQLRGPVALRVQDSVDVRDLSVLGSASEAGAPRLELQQVEAKRVSAGDDSQHFQGSIVLRSATLEDLDLRSADLTLESVSTKKATLQAQHASLTDVYLEDTAFDVDTAVISAIYTISTRLHVAGDTLLVKSRHFQTSITVEAGATVRLYSTDFHTGALDGSFELDSASIETTRFGGAAPTELLVFTSSISASQLCDQTAQLAVGSDSFLKCNACGTSFQPEQYCYLPYQRTSMGSNYCRALKADPAPTCPAELGGRKRPVTYP